eukprot:3017103-Prymnesium_polylepis.2
MARARARCERTWAGARRIPCAPHSLGGRRCRPQVDGARARERERELAARRARAAPFRGCGGRVCGADTASHELVCSLTRWRSALVALQPSRVQFLLWQSSAWTSVFEPSCSPELLAACRSAACFAA